MDQAEYLRKLLAERKGQKISAKSAETIAVISGKGGVGKSNLSLNLSLSLLERNKKVLLIDLDIGMGNIDVLLGQSSRYSLADLLQQEMSFQKAMTAGPLGLQYISGGSGLNSIIELNEQKWSFFSRELEELLDKYDYVIFDMGAGLTKEQLPFVVSSTHILVVATPEPTSLMDAYSAMKHITLNKKDLRFHVLMNRCLHQREGELAFSKLSKTMRTFLQQRISYLGNVPEDPLVRKAVTAQLPFVISHPHSKLSKSIYRVADAFLHTEEKRVEAKEASFLNKLSAFFRRG
ncbi:MinD/ParA family protein [Bacillus gobiensis]|uniref:MinD/ParA family protein n=1 Tax=Bacillus gobiensis TaxID=1441095 RepID=UPI003D259922